jgi:hypothetical protein
MSITRKKFRFMAETLMPEPFSACIILPQDIFSRHPMAGERPHAVLPIPYGERPTDYRWNSNLLALDGNCCSSEMDAGYFILPYWMVCGIR